MLCMLALSKLMSFSTVNNSIFSEVNSSFACSFASVLLYPSSINCSFNDMNCESYLSFISSNSYSHSARVTLVASYSDTSSVIRSS